MKLPLNCQVEYFPAFLSQGEAQELYDLLLTEYALDKARLVIEAGGQLLETDSFKFLFLTPELIGKKTHPEEIHGKNHAWSGALAELREKVEREVGKQFEIAMCLFYPDGSYGCPYHSDQTTSGAKTILPSISLGATRKFSFREKEGDDEYSLDLAHGSLLLMGDHCQDRYEHSLLEDPACNQGRINITFREPKFQ